MRAAEALSRLLAQKRPVIETGVAANLLSQSVSATSHQLRDLADAGLIAHIGRGLWSLTSLTDPLVVGSWITDPDPSYVSLYSALRFHGMIQQLPQTIFVVSTGKTRHRVTEVGTFSIHQIHPALFGGFEEERERRIATPEKAVFDALYLERARSGRFHGLTEVELPEHFSAAALREWVDKIPDPSHRKHVMSLAEDWLDHHSNQGPPTSI